MYHRKQRDPKNFLRRPDSLSVVVWITIAMVVLLCTATVIISRRYESRMRATSRTIDRAGGQVMGRDVYKIQFSGPHITNVNLSRVKHLKDTRWLELHSTRVTDEGLDAIADWKNLRELFLNANSLTDQSLDVIRHFQKLEWLELNGSQVTDAGLAKLTGLTNLKRLDLMSCTGVTTTGVQQLQAKLPNCSIHWSSDPWLPLDQAE